MAVMPHTDQRQRTSRRARTGLAVTLGALLGAVTLGALLGAGAVAGPVAASVTGSPAPVAGGITVYQARFTGAHIVLGSQRHPSLILTKAVPPGQYLVHALVGVDVQPGSFDVCAVANVENGNDGVFSTSSNGSARPEVNTLAWDEVLTIGAGQSIRLMCDDNAAQRGNWVDEAVLEAVPVSTLS
jgi:hypothetical protein